MVHIERFLGTVGRTISCLFSSPPETPELKAYLAELRKSPYERAPHHAIASALRESGRKGTDIDFLAHRLDTVASGKLQERLQRLIGDGVVWQRDDMVGLRSKQQPRRGIFRWLLPG